VSWESKKGYKSDPDAFLFSLTNKDNKPCKMNIHPNPNEYAIKCDYWMDHGPSFGGDDIRLHRYPNKGEYDYDWDVHRKNFSNLGRSYKHPQYDYMSDEAQSFLAGAHTFLLDEIEVYQKGD
jgi:hypothetical protein